MNYLCLDSTAKERSVFTCACEVMDVIPLSKDTFQLNLQSPAGRTLDYHAGQYLQLELDLNGDGQTQSLHYSTANSFNPEQPRCLQIFIRKSSELTDKILKHPS
jgi:CDP-4-dehydro-6-deoxyglucose reductase